MPGVDATGLNEIATATAALIAAIITGFLVPVIRKLGEWVAEKVGGQKLDKLYPILMNALAWGQAMVAKDADAAADEGDALRQKIIGLGKSYARLHAPGLIEELGVTDDALQRMLEARLQQIMAFARIMIPGISDRHAALLGLPPNATLPSAPAAATN